MSEPINSTFPTSEAIDKIVALAKPQVHELMDIHGRKSQFATAGLVEVKAAPPSMIPKVEVFTLAALRDLIVNGLDKAEYEKIGEECFLHVENESTVVLVDKDGDSYGRRQILAKASPVPFKGFPFERWMDQETFAIAIASQFADGFDKDYVVQLAASLTSEAMTTNEDNGFTQRGTVQSGLAHKRVTDIKPRVTLAPYRTFPELTQVESQFVFRARISEGQDKSKVIALCLFEADGGTWKIEAIRRIKERLESFETGVPVIA